MDAQEAMDRALAQARSVEGRTSPRPPVGAVVVRDGFIRGQGATAPPYGPHAEVEALVQAGEMAREATLYVTLEPCCVHIHTPPCTDAIIAAGVRRVVVGTLDPNPAVRGQGIARLRAAGIEVVLLEEGAVAREAADLIRPFARAITGSRPYVTAKWAMTLDGKLATRDGDACWISGPDARLWVHDLRDRVDAILVGAGTARADNPHLTVRLSAGQRRWPRTARSSPPLRVIMAGRGELPPDLVLLQPDLAGGTCIITGEACPYTTLQRLRERGAEVLAVAENAGGYPDLVAALTALHRRGITHVLMEGGAHLLGSAFDHHCIDHVAVFVSPKLVGGHAAPSPLAGEGRATMTQACTLQNIRKTFFEKDVLIEGDIA